MVIVPPFCVALSRILAEMYSTNSVGEEGVRSFTVMNLRLR